MADEKSSGLAKAFKALDLHPKLVSDFVVRTKCGGFVSIAAIIIAALLFVSELKLFWSLERIEHMEVDDMRGSHMKMRINFDVTFPDMPCAMVSLDAMDASGSHSLDVLHNVFKKRLDSAGNEVGEGERDEKRTLKSTADLLKEKQKAIAEGRHVEGAVARPPGTEEGYCGSCYGAGAVGECCNTCENVREAYRRKGWQFVMKGMEQCSREGFYGDVTAQAANKEGCNVYGYLEAPKVPGNVHFAPGAGLQHAYAHTHDLVSFAHENFNISHRINSISFGPYFPGAVYPIDGLRRPLLEGSGMHQYFLKLVPIVYQHSTGAVTEGFQFSVTEHLKKLNQQAAEIEAATGLLPGVFFNYELSPMRVRVEERRRSLLHFLTKVCAILGGVFTVMGLLDSLLFRGIEEISRSRRKNMKSSGGLMQ